MSNHALSHKLLSVVAKGLVLVSLIHTALLVVVADNSIPAAVTTRFSDVPVWMSWFMLAWSSLGLLDIAWQDASGRLILRGYISALLRHWFCMFYFTLIAAYFLVLSFIFTVYGDSIGGTEIWFAYCLLTGMLSAGLSISIGLEPRRDA